MKLPIKKIFIWGLHCAKRGLIMLFPMLMVAFELMEIITMANYHYPNNTSVFILECIGVIFYISCLCCILMPFQKWNKIFFLVSTCLLIGMIKLNPDIRKIAQHARCIESSTPCPEGVVLGGG